jgi:tetratricopeptide repeat protein 8
MSQSGRPLSGFTRPGTQGGRPGTMEQAIRTPRTAHTARPVTSASGRYVRPSRTCLVKTMAAN